MNTRIMIALLALPLYLGLAWFTGTFLQLEGRDLWILRTLLSLIGVIAATVFVWFEWGKANSGVEAGAGNTKDIDLILRTAEDRLRRSRLGRKARIANLPAFLILGGQDSAKTTVMLQSGTESELLAGQAQGEGAVVPTELANCWYAGGAIFIEAGARLIGDAAAWRRVVRSLHPGWLRLIRRGQQPARAAVVCVSCEQFMQLDGRGMEGLARKTRAALESVASALGIRIPVYVLFTKADRIPYFKEFFRNLTAEEASQVLGATLPLETTAGVSVYAERATQRIGDALRNLLFAVAGKRPEFLSRESDAGKLGDVYEFPRELGKFRASMIAFLVELCRPSQLATAPLLRGFYFTGVRAVVVDDRPAVAERRPESRSVQRDVDATSIFRSPELAAPRPAVNAGVTGRKVPQWPFLSHFFSDVLFKDTVAQGTAGASARTTPLRRVALLAGAVALLALAVALTISFTGNRQLARQLTVAAEQIAAGATGQAATEQSLASLEQMRVALEQVSQYEKEGAPLRLRWGLYSGAAIYPEARSAYFEKFNQLLLRPVQERLVAALRSMPAVADQSDNYGLPYDSLKAYLITTSNPEKSTPQFLVPVLTSRWSEGISVPVEQLQIVQRQFDFYARELAISNPFDIAPDEAAVLNARRYLMQFAGAERVYRAILAEAAQANPPVTFNQRFPGSAEVLTNNREVSGAFSRNGWTAVNAALKNIDRYFSGEQWVLGDLTGAAFDRAQLERDLRARFTADFIGQWRGFLSASSIARYASAADAANKLNRLAGNQSPLLFLLQLASEMTGVDAPEVQAAFQPVHFVVPPASTVLIGESNAKYMSGLLSLQAAIDQVANAPGGRADDNLINQAAMKASEAKVAARQLGQNFKPDPLGGVDRSVQKLLEDPITNVEGMVRNIVPGELNAQGRAMCGPVQDLLGKFPFNANSTREATLQEMAAVFHPAQGSLWSFFNASLAKYMMKQGSGYVENPAGGMRLNPAFTTYWNRVAAFTEMVYPAGADQPRIPFAVQLVANPGVESVRLSVDGQTQQSAGSSPMPMQFVWSGSGQPVALTARFGNSDYSFGRYDGPWAFFRFLADSENWSAAGSTSTFERIVRQGQQGTPLLTADGTRVSLKFELDTRRTPLFRRDYFAGLSCVSQIARP